MKTKIIYISGNEVFDMADIRAAFEEVRMALNLDKTTVLFGVPVDADDAGFMTDKQPEAVKEKETVVKDIPEPIEIPKDEDTVPEAQEEIVTEPAVKNDESTDDEEKIVPIMSILSTKSEQDEDGVIISQEIEEVEIIPEISEEKTEEIVDEETTIENDGEQADDDDEEDLEKLLSAMTPLEEDVLENKKSNESVAEPTDTEENVSVDATLEQLATEFVETQDKITSGNKSSSRGKIGKLRNILPFKQSKHKDQGLGDLFGWAGAAANDEDFSVPGFFTNAASKK